MANWTKNSFSNVSVFQDAVDDLKKGAKSFRLGAFLAWRESFLSYRLGFLGPAWITIQSALWVFVIGIFVGPSLKLDGGYYIAYIALGFSVFNLLSLYFVEGSQVFISGKRYILNVPNPFSIFAYKLIYKSLLQLVMVLPIIILAMIIERVPLGQTIFLSFFGLILALIFGFGAALLLGTASVLHRDLTFAIQAVMRLMMFVTPIFWVLQGGGMRMTVSSYNPIHIYLQVIRQPMLGQPPSTSEWTVAIILAFTTLIIGCLVFVTRRHKLAVWL